MLMAKNDEVFSLVNGILWLLYINIYILHNLQALQRGAMVEWLEHLAVVWKVAGSSPTRAKRLENSHCPPSSEWVPD